MTENYCLIVFIFEISGNVFIIIVCAPVWDVKNVEIYLTFIINFCTFLLCLSKASVFSMKHRPKFVDIV